MMKHRIGRKIWLLLALLSIISLLRVIPADASAPVGTVEDIRRLVVVERGGKQLEVANGFELRAFDIIRTGNIGSALVRLQDDTLLEIGPSSEVDLFEVVFLPERAELFLSIKQGWTRIRTGSIGLKNPRGVKISTPRNLIRTSNSLLGISVTPEEESIEVEIMPPGPKVSVLNTVTKECVEIAEPQMLLMTYADNVVALLRTGPEKVKERDESYWDYLMKRDKGLEP